MTALFSSPKMPNIPAAPPPPPQLPNQAVGDAVSEQQQQAAGANGVNSTVATSAQGVTQAGPKANPGLAAIVPTNVAATIIGGSGAFTPSGSSGQSTLLG
jgi:hypothetical protein